MDDRGTRLTNGDTPLLDSDESSSTRSRASSYYYPHHLPQYDGAGDDDDGDDAEDYEDVDEDDDDDDAEDIGDVEKEEAHENRLIASQMPSIRRIPILSRRSITLNGPAGLRINQSAADRPVPLKVNRVVLCST